MPLPLKQCVFEAFCARLEALAGNVAVAVVTVFVLVLDLVKELLRNRTEVVNVLTEGGSSFLVVSLQS